MDSLMRPVPPMSIMDDRSLMDFIDLSGILIAAVLVFLLGAIWYSPFLFGRTWMELVGHNKEEEQKGAVKSMALSFIFSVMSVFAIDIILEALGVPDLISMVSTVFMAFLFWFGFEVPIYLSAVLCEKRPWKLSFINASYGFVTKIIIFWTLLS